MFRLALACLAACLVCCAGQLKVDDLNVPPGFSVNVFANDTWGARSLAISRNTTYPGTVLYVSTDTSVRLHSTIFCSYAMALHGSQSGCSPVTASKALRPYNRTFGGLQASLEV